SSAFVVLGHHDSTIVGDWIFLHGCCPCTVFDDARFGLGLLPAAEDEDGEERDQRNPDCDDGPVAPPRWLGHWRAIYALFTLGALRARHRRVPARRERAETLHDLIALPEAGVAGDHDVELAICPLHGIEDVRAGFYCDILCRPLC